MKIPTSFRLFASTINVEMNNKLMHERNNYGEARYSSCLILLSSIDNGESMSEDRIMDTFYHEKVHMILNSMEERELSKNEKFVDIFAKLLRQSDETAEYQDDEI